ncbi:BspA type Leucine rich repeat region (6 copies) [Popillia japonica]|uniref:BspA type Leucine rich repeat region (6 copies) n=1 Tax=Popillia japonica TaxID=7064 RepID=A0AAW1MIS6_POPJA
MFQKNFTKLLLFCVIFSQYIKGNYSECNSFKQTEARVKVHGIFSQYIKGNYSECNSFKQTEARVKVHGKSEWKTLSGCLNNLPYEEIYIKDCVKILHQGTFKDMLDLKRIVIEEGNLKEISANFTENTPDLGDISIRKNTLVKLYKNVFPKVLDKLDLTSNRISTVEESAFEDVTVSLLILDDNNLKNIESKWFHNSRIKNRNGSIIRESSNYL